MLEYRRRRAGARGLRSAGSRILSATDHVDRSTRPGLRGALIGVLIMLASRPLTAGAEERWAPVGPAAASVLALVPSPHDPAELVAATLFGGLYRTLDRGVSWAHLSSPFSTFPVFSVAYDPVMRGTIYAGTFGAGAFKSIDGGRSWVSRSDGLTNDTVSAMAIDRNDPRVVLAATDAGVFRSTDGAETWRDSSGDLGVVARSLVFDPERTGVVYLGTLRSGVYRSDDAGITWRAFNDGLTASDVSALDFGTDGTLYAATGTGAFCLSSGSARWQDITFGLPPAPIHHVAEHPQDGRLFAATEHATFTLDRRAGAQAWVEWAPVPSRLVVFESGGDLIYLAAVASKLVATLDDGATFFPIQQGIQNLFAGALASMPVGETSVVLAGSDLGAHLTSEFFRQGNQLPWTQGAGLPQAVFGLAAHPTQLGVVFAGTEGAGVWRSGDWGVTWEQSSSGIVPTRIFAVSQSPVGARTLYAGTSAGVYISRDDGGAWALATTLAISAQILEVLADPALPGVAYFTTDDGRVFRSIDDGASFQPISVGLPGDPILDMAAAPFGNLYALTSAGKLFISSDGGATWFPAAAEVDEPIIAVSADRERPFVAYLGTSFGGVYRTETDGLSWEAVNDCLRVPIVFSLAIDRHDAQVLYAGSVDTVFKSLDGGDTWTESGAGLPAGFVYQIATDPVDADAVYASVIGAGIYKSSDRGLSWEQSVGGPPFDGNVPIALSESTAQKLFAGSAREGIFTSTDGGATYTPASEGMTLFVRGLSVSPGNPDRLFAASLSEGVFRSLDGGQTWTQQGLDDRRNLFGIASNPLDGEIVYAATSVGVARSTDAGETWVDLGQRTAFAFSLVVDPADRNSVYVGSSAGRMFRSTDGGLTWTLASGELPPTNIIALALDPAGTLYASAERQGVFRSADGGETWESTDGTLIGTAAITDLVVQPVTGLVFAASNGSGLFRSADRGVTWERVGTEFDSPIVSSVDVHPLGAVYASTESASEDDRAVYVSFDSGVTWAPRSTGVGSSRVLDLTVSPHDSAMLYAATFGAVYRSSDGGATWHASEGGLEGVEVRTLLVDTHEDHVVFAGTRGRGIFKSTDGGRTWSPTATPFDAVTPTELAPGVAAGQLYAATLETGLLRSSNRGDVWTGGVEEGYAQPIVLALAVNPHDPQVLYAAAAGAGLLKTTDGGLTWQLVGREIGSSFILAIAVDPREPATVYVGTAGGGVYATEDDGASWTPLNDGLFNVNVTSLVTDSVDPRIVYVGTEGGGVFRLDRRDRDGDGVTDEDDCAPRDPRLATAHTFYHDYDGDSYGTERVVPDLPPEFEIETAVDTCELIPVQGPEVGRGVVAWPGDPWDFDGFRFPPTVEKGGRLLGADLTYLAEDGSFPDGAIIDLGIDATVLHLFWQDLETAPGVYDGSQVPALANARERYGASDLKVSLTVSPIVGPFLVVPADVRTDLLAGRIRFDDPEIIDRFARLLTFVHGALAGLEVVSVQVGYEVDRYLSQNTDGGFWQAYAAFHDAAASHARALWGEHVPVSSVWTYQSYLNPAFAPLRGLIEGVDDVVSLTFFPAQPDFTVVEPERVPDLLRQLSEKAFPKPIHFQAVGYPSAPVTGSSTTKQSQFVRAFFTYWDQAGASVPFVSFGQLHDSSPAQTEAQLNTGVYDDVGVDEDPGARARVAGFLSSAGLRNYAGTGERKPAYDTLRNHAFDRGWFRDVERTSRPFLMGFTTAHFDFPPDPTEQVAVSAWLREHLRTDGDMVLLHFDGGVPWVEAYADDFSSAELPYSADLRGSFINNRSLVPEGARLAVAINPLGVPRDYLAPYWGVGQGFSFDETFRRVPNGQIADAEKRYPPPPWDTLRLNDDAVKIAYLNYCKRVLQFFRPDYLVVGIEVSAALVHDRDAYEDYFELHRFVYESLKADPEFHDVPIMVSFSATSYMVDEFGVAYKFDEQAPGLRDAQLDALVRFLPYTDVVGLSLYPHFGKYNAYSQPAMLYDELFAILERAGAANKPIAVTESGYTAEEWDILDGFLYTGTPEKQDAHYKLLFRELARQANPVEFVVTFKVRDSDRAWQRQVEALQPDTPIGDAEFVEFLQFFRDIGIYDGDGNLRPAGETWHRELDLPYLRRGDSDDAAALRSPDGRLEATFSVSPVGDLQYTLRRDHEVIISSSPLGLTVDGEDLGRGIRGIQLSGEVTVEDSYPTLGVHAAANVTYSEAQIHARRAASDEALGIEVRVHDDGLAYRYVIPGAGLRQIEGEASGWRLPAGSRVWHQPDAVIHEGEYGNGVIGEFAGRMAAPLTARSASGTYLMITEAGLQGYSGLSFSTAGTAARLIQAEFLGDVAWTVPGGSKSPWRVLAVSPDLDGLVNADLITALNEPPDPTLFPAGPHTAWIRPGRAVWSEWSDPASPFDLHAQLQFVDAAAALGFEYVIVGPGWEIGFPFFGMGDQFQALASLATYAHSDGRNVDLLVWKSSAELQDPDTRRTFLAAAAQAGAAGVKVDFVLPESQATVDFTAHILQEAAARQLVVMFNNVAKPTGGERTFPNEVTREAVRGLEYSRLGMPPSPEHDTTLPFTRLLAGPAAVTPVTFDPSTLGATTVAHQLATAGVFTSPLQIWAGNPLHLSAQSAAGDVLRAIPSVWDETRVLPESAIGELVVMARRNGGRWFLFVLNGDSTAGRDVNDLDLSFLGADRYDAAFLGDGARDAFLRVAAPGIDRSFDLDVRMLAGGGFVGMFTPAGLASGEQPGPGQSAGGVDAGTGAGSPPSGGSTGDAGSPVETSSGEDGTPGTGGVPSGDAEPTGPGSGGPTSGVAAATPDDADGDGVVDEEDCAPTDPDVSSLHTYYIEADGDGFGDPNARVVLCSVSPFPGTVVWGRDPNPTDNAVFPRIVPKGDRMLGVDFGDAAEDGAAGTDLARELGAEATTVHLLWSLLETAPGVFDGAQAGLLPGINDLLATDGFALNLTVSPVVQDQLTVPGDLEDLLKNGGLRFDAPEIVDRFRALLDFVHGQLPDVAVVSLQIGHEIDRHLAVEPSPQFWEGYFRFFLAVREHARSLWGADVPVGITATRRGLVTEPTASLMSALNSSTDIVSATYLPRNDDFTVVEPEDVRGQVVQLLNRYPGRRISFQTVAFPSAPATRSSRTMQSQFLWAFFDTWDAHASRIPFVSFARLHDHPPDRARAEAERPVHEATEDSTPRAAAYFESLGLRTFSVGGEAKSAYHTLRNLAFDRDWWRVAPRDSRSFLLGFTTHPYDHNPGGPLIDEVLDDIFATAVSDGDLLAYHFDGGVPWVEALGDTFTSHAPPYSDHVREVWEKHRTRRPAGMALAVSINPLGIPRTALAPYWGFGEGFYHDGFFRLVGTGVFQDYQERLRPPPFDRLDLGAPEVKAAFLNYARRTIDYFNPAYLISGLEVNLALDSGDPAVFQQYVDLQRFVYEGLRADPAYDHVKIVVSFVAEHLMTDEFGVPLLFDGIRQQNLEARHLQALQALLPYTDVVGLSIYPVKTRFGTNLTVASAYDDLFGKLRAMTDKPLAITETGYPAATFAAAGFTFESDPRKQARFLRLLFSEVEKHGGAEFIVNFTTRDLTPHMDRLRERALEDPPFISPNLVEFLKGFEFIGVYAADGTPREARDLFRETKALPLDDPPSTVPPVVLVSPAENVVATIGADGAGRLFYSVTRDGLPVLEASPLGVTVDGVDLGQGVVRLTTSATRTVDETYAVRGVHDQARNHYNEATVTVGRTGSGDAAFDLVIRLYDDGVAYRYIVPGSGERTVSGEASGWTLPEGAEVWYHTNTGNYESVMFLGTIGGFDDDMGGPITVELPGGAGILTLTEADLRNYSGMTLDADLGSRLVASEFLDDFSWTVSGGAVGPWRLAIVTGDLTGLVNSDMVSNVSSPPDPVLFPDGVFTSWIRPGKAVWSFWNDFRSGFSFDVQRQYVDAAAALGVEYVVVDAWWEEGFPVDGRDQFQRLAELVEYAHSDGRSVDIWVWRSWWALLAPEERRGFFQSVKDAGAVGVKIDNNVPGQNESVLSLQVTEEMLRDAAAAQLMVNFHGSNKPTGLSRTYPNEITREGLAGLELNGLGWEFGQFIPPHHNAVLPFTRFIAGPGDYTPVTFDPRKIGHTTFTHQLATAGLFTSPLIHLAGDPARLLEQQTVVDVLRALPVVWDETLVIKETVIGQLAGMARRAGDDWYLFIVNGDAGGRRALNDLDLTFLGTGRYDAVLINDETATSFERTDVPEMDAGYELDVDLLPGGGFVGRFTPHVDETRSFRMGFTHIPPANTDAGWMAVYGALRDHTDLVAHTFQTGVPWPEALRSADYRSYPTHLRAMWELLRTANQTVIPDHAVYLMVSPIQTSFDRLAPYWGETGEGLPLPAPWNQYDLSHPDVRTAYVNFLIAAIECFQPRYLATSVEGNIFLAKQPLQWQAFKEFNAFVYDAIKARYPDLVVFPTIHYEHMLGLHAESARLAEQLHDVYPDVLEQEVRALLRHSDLMAISTYPYMVFGNPFLVGGANVVTDDYYERAYAIARDLGLRIAIDQVGYLSQPVFFEPFGITLVGSEELQRNFLRFVLREALRHDFEFLNNFVALDYGTNFGTHPTTLTWAYTGLLNEDGSLKAALDEWDGVFDLPRRPTVAEGGLRTAGAVRATMVGQGRVDYELENGFVARVEVVAEDVVRVRVNAGGALSDRVSGAIVANGEPPPEVAIADTATTTFLVSDELSVVVSKAPFGVSVLRPDGRVVTADQPSGIGWDELGGVIFDRKFALEDEAYFGLGLRGGPLNRRGDAFFMRNTDNFGYGEFTQPLYSSTPFFYGARDGDFYGLFVDSPAEPAFDMDSSGEGTLLLAAHQKELDYYLLAGPRPQDVARQYAGLTGLIPLPPKWALGFHQSRFGYTSWEEILDIATTFRQLEIPADAVYLDLDYMNDLDVFSWNPVGFPDPVTNNETLEAMGFKRVNIVDPSIQPDDPLYGFLNQAGFFLRDAQGAPVTGRIFEPFGDVSWLDFSNPAAARWYVARLREFLGTGVSGIWNDINEPASNFMPQAIHDFAGERRTDREARNLYALTEVALTQEAMLETRPNERPFILSRSGYAGSQRYNANWSGDSLSSFDSLRVSIQLSQHMALSGMVLFGHDIGGFLGAPNAELFTRWMQFASLTPFMRNHAVNTTAPREPWVYGEPYTSIIRDAINQRYRWMPYLYSLVERASRTAEPVLAPTFFHFPEDTRTFEQDTEFMLGEFLLVAPVFVEQAMTRTLYLPEGADWYEWHSGTPFGGGQEITVAAPLDRIPIFVRAGAVVPAGPVVQHVTEAVPPRVEVDVYPGPNGEFELYEDDGITFDFTRGMSLRTRITATSSGETRTVSVAAGEGGWQPPERPWWVYFHDVRDPPAAVSVSGVLLDEAPTRAALEDAEAGWFYSADDAVVTVRVAQSQVPGTIVVAR